MKAYYSSIPTRIGAGLAMLALCSLSTLESRAAVANVAWLQGTELENGSNSLGVGEPTSIRWADKTNIDPSTYELSFADPTKLTVLKDGDYFIAVTAPHNGAAVRPASRFEAYVNGNPAPGALGQSTYIRNASGHQESSGHFATLLTGLNANDVIEVKTHQLNAIGSPTVLETASLYAEHIDASRTAFAATATETRSGPNLNIPEFTDDPAVVWTSTRKDSGFTHSDGAPEIRLGSGPHLVLANMPLEGAVTRASVALQVVMDNAIIGVAQQGYIRNTSGHTQSSVHFSGLVEGPGTLSFEVVARAGTSGTPVTVPAGKVGSVFIEKIDSSSPVFHATTFETQQGFTWNPDEKQGILWGAPTTVDSSVYSHTANPSSGHEIQIRQDGAYLLVYNDALEGGGTRTNPRITVEVNGIEVPGAQTKTHYLRNATSHRNSSASLVVLLDDISQGDTVTMSVEREGGGGDPEIEFSIFEAPAQITLIQREPLDISTLVDLPPKISSFSSDLFGFEVEIQDLGLAVDEGSVSVTLDNAAVTPTVSKADGLTTVRYAFADFPDPGSSHTVDVSFSDSAGGSHQVGLPFRFLISESL